MTVVEHLSELRRRVIISLIGFVVVAAIAYWYAPAIIRFFLQYYKDATNGRAQAFIFTGPVDAFLTRLKVATYVGIIGSLPIWAWQLWRFITPGLHKNEKKYAVPFILCSVALFLFGAFIAYFIMPYAVEFLIGYSGPVTAAFTPTSTSACSAS